MEIKVHAENTDTKFVAQFKVYKAGVTTGGWIQIISKNGEPFNKLAKMEKYLSLGYTIKE